MNIFKRRYHNKNNTRLIVGFFFVFISTLFLSIGFSTYQATIDIDSMDVAIRVNADIRVVRVSPTNSVANAQSQWEDYNVASISSKLHLPNANSTMEYEIEVLNTGNVMQGIYDIDEIYKRFGTQIDSNLEIKSKTLTLKQALCDDIDPTQCKLGTTSTFRITIGYANGGFDGTNLTHSIELDFDFRRVFDITYNGFSSTSGLPSRMIQGDTLEVQFTSTTGIPYDVEISGASGDWPTSSPSLYLSNITIVNTTDTIVINRKYSVTYSGFSGSTSGLISSILYSGGTIEFNNTTGIPDNLSISGATGDWPTSKPVLHLTNITGNVTITAATTPSGDGTYNNPYINTGTYDPSNMLDGYTQYINMPGSPKVHAQVTQSGTTITGFEYTDAGQNGVIFGPNDNPTLNTGILALDGSALSIHIIFRTNLNLNQGKFILSAIQQNQNSTYSGFSLNVISGSVPYLSMSSHMEKTYSNDILNATSTQNLNTKTDAQSNTENLYEVTITYTPNASQPLIANYNNTTKKIKKNSLSSNLDNAIITIGGNGLNNVDDMNSLKVLTLQVCKGTFDSNYMCNTS